MEIKINWRDVIMWISLLIVFILLIISIFRGGVKMKEDVDLVKDDLNLIKKKLKIKNA